MSNVIKSHYINVGSDKKVINWNQGFTSLANSSMEVVVNEEALANAGAPNQNGFMEGLDVVNMQRLMEEEEELISKKADRLLLEANEAAEQIVEDARREAEVLKQQAIEDGRKTGYLEGFEQGKAEVANLELKLEQQLSEAGEDYRKMVAELEPKFATVVVSLVEKLTGIVVEEQKDVIMHLIGQAMSEVQKSKNFLVKVSSEDYQTVVDNKERILKDLPENVELHISEEDDFVKGQCFIEADGKIIDCSLDVQMKSLITDLKLLAGI